LYCAKHAFGEAMRRDGHEASESERDPLAAVALAGRNGRGHVCAHDYASEHRAHVARELVRVDGSRMRSGDR